MCGMLKWRQFQMTFSFLPFHLRYCGLPLSVRMNNWFVTHRFSSFYVRKSEQSGAAEACWAHNPEVDGSKPSSANSKYSESVGIQALSTGANFWLDKTALSRSVFCGHHTIVPTGIRDKSVATLCFPWSSCDYGDIFLDLLWRLLEAVGKSQQKEGQCKVQQMLKFGPCKTEYGEIQDKKKNSLSHVSCQNLPILLL